MRRWTLLILGLFLIGALGVSAGLAQNGGPFGLLWFTVDGGGASSSGGPYALTGTLGQADAGSMTGGGYNVEGGFWPGLSEAIPAPTHGVYLPLAVKNP